MEPYFEISVVKKNNVIDTYEDVRFYPKSYNIIISQDVNVLRKKGTDLKNITTESEINYNNIGYDNKKVGTIKSTMMVNY